MIRFIFWFLNDTSTSFLRLEFCAIFLLILEVGILRVKLGGTLILVTWHLIIFFYWYVIGCIFLKRIIYVIFEAWIRCYFFNFLRGKYIRVTSSVSIRLFFTQVYLHQQRNHSRPENGYRIQIFLVRHTQIKPHNIFSGNYGSVAYLFQPPLGLQLLHNSELVRVGIMFRLFVHSST